MVTIYNKSKKPIGVGKQFCLPGDEMQVQDRDAYCEVFDEYGKPTGKKQLLPGLKAIERQGFITIKEEKAAAKDPVVETVEETANIHAVEEAVPEKKTRTRKAKAKDE